MNKMSINDFPSLDGVSLIPTKTLELMIDIYNKEVDKENILYEDKVKYKASLVKKGKSKAALFSELKQLKKNDSDWHTGQLFGLIYEAGQDVEDIVKEAAAMNQLLKAHTM